MAEQRKQSVLNGALILAFGVLLVKVIGLVFKMPLTDMLGSVGRGYFNSAYEIYAPIYSISMAGLPVAVSKMVSESIARNRYREARMILKVATFLFFITGLAGTIILLLISYPYANRIAGLDNLPAILTIAPSIFFCCAFSAYRGYYQGQSNMIPTAVSQIIEAFGKMVFGLAFAYVILQIGTGQYKSGVESGLTEIIVFGKEVYSPAQANTRICAWSAAGATLGVTIGSVLSYIFLLIYHKIKGDSFTKTQLAASPRAPEFGILSRRMIAIAVPMVISSLILNITNLIDATTIQRLITVALEKDFSQIFSMYKSSFELAAAEGRLDINDIKNVAKYLWGAYGTALDFRNLVPTITASLGVSAIPALSAAWALKNKKTSKTTIETVIRIAMLIALPAGLGMAILSTPILTLIYGRGESVDAIPIAAKIMTAFGCITPIMAISTPVTNLLQAIGRTDIPVKSMIIGSAVKIGCNIALIQNPKINVMGAVVGTVMFFVVTVLFNLISLFKITKIKINFMSVFIKPLISAAFCGVAAWSVYGIFARILPVGSALSLLNGNNVAALIAIAAAVLVYAISLLLTRTLAKDDIISLPKGEKIVKVLEKYNFIG